MSPVNNTAAYICSKCVNMSRLTKTQDREKKAKKIFASHISDPETEDSSGGCRKEVCFCPSVSLSVLFCCIIKGSG